MNIDLFHMQKLRDRSKRIIEGADAWEPGLGKLEQSISAPEKNLIPPSPISVVSQEMAKNLNLNLIHDSIKYWCDIAFREGVCKGGTTCPLCREYHSTERTCSNPLGNRCPIKTLKEGCHNTPYEQWVTHHRVAHDYNGIMPELVVKCSKCKRLAIAEIECLCEVYRLEAERR